MLNPLASINANISRLDTCAFWNSLILGTLAITYIITASVYFPNVEINNLCEGVVCPPNNACLEWECQQNTGDCVATTIEPGCCVDATDCAEIQGTNCLVPECNVDNRCEFVIPLTGECFADSQCGNIEVCDEASCGCVDLCDGVVCPQDECEVRRCDQYTGQCVTEGFLPNCCVIDADCPTLNPCIDAMCVNNECLFNSVTNATCVLDAGCPVNSFCIDCMCTDVPGNCESAADCSVGTNCTIDVCSPNFQCESIPIPGCCSMDSECEDMNDCTSNQCINNMCVFNRLDQDLDGFLCGVDCDDMNATIGPPFTSWRDEDGDGRGDPNVFVVACDIPPGFVNNFLDCDDLRPETFNGAETCNLGNQFVLADPLPNPVEPFFFECGFDVAVYNNLTSYLCRFYEAPGPIDEGGKIQMAVFDGNSWVLTDSFEILDTTTPGFASVAIYEDLVVVGIENLDDPVTMENTGIANVFRYDFVTNTLIFLQTLSPGSLPGFVGGEDFGTAVSITENHITVGAPNTDSSGNNNGAVVVFERTGPSTWTFLQTIDEQFNYNTNLMFGTSVSMFNETMVIGAPRPGSTGSYVSQYVLTGGTWVFDWTFPVGGSLDSNHQIGIDVSTDGETVVSGSNSVSAALLGTLYILDIDDGTVIQSFVRPDPSRIGINDQFANAVSVYDGVIVVGCARCDGLIRDSGASFVYLWTPVEGLEWNYARKTYPTDNSRLVGNRFGFSVQAMITIVSGSRDRSPQPGGFDTGGSYISTCQTEFVCPPLN